MTDKFYITLGESPTAAIIVIGNEILSGRTKDENINYIAKELNALGIRLCEVRVIPDLEKAIINTVNEMKVNFHYIFTTGGIGPTHDDITAESIAKAFGSYLVRNEEAFLKMNEYYQGNMNEGRLKMTKMPEGAEIIANPISIAPGFKIGNVYVFAGIPNVMRAMFDNIKHSLKGGAPILSKELKVYCSESKIAAPLTQLQEMYPVVEIGSYPFVKDNKLGVSIALRSTRQDMIDIVYNEMKEIFKDFENPEKK